MSVQQRIERVEKSLDTIAQTLLRLEQYFTSERPHVDAGDVYAQRHVEQAFGPSTSELMELIGATQHELTVATQRRRELIATLRACGDALDTHGASAHTAVRERIREKVAEFDAIYGPPVQDELQSEDQSEEQPQ